MTDPGDVPRLAAIDAYDVLEGEPRRELRALADLAARIAGVEMAAVNVFTEDEQHQIATSGSAPVVCAREDALCNTVLETGAAILLEDVRVDPRFRDNPYINGERGSLRFYASHPLVTPEGVIIGTLCAYDVVPHPVTADLESDLAMLAERVVDVLELELTGRRLATANEQLSTSNERLGAFAGQISHDLKNPLSAISMSLEMAQDEVADKADIVATLLARASRGAERMNSMIGDLLAFAKGSAAPELLPVDLSEVLKQVIEDLGDGAADFDVRAEGLPVVSGDPVQLRAVLQNLVANAVKFTRPDVTPVVDITARSTPGHWRVEVADNGPGVAEADRQRVFEPFNRLDKRVPGTGIGLSTCRRILEAHGGRIGLTEAPGGGALVWFELPR